MKIKKTPGQVLRDYRESKGLTMSSFAEILHCSKSEISLYESDKKEIGKIRRLFWSSIIPQFTPDMLTAEGQKPADG